MNVFHLLNIKRPNQRGGFALISVLSIIVLLAFVGVALLTLSSVRMRSAGGEKDQKQAQENAKLALMEAIGELQITTGPDTRITAPADALAGAPAGSKNHVRQLTGVWRSWEGMNHERTETGDISDNVDTTPGANDTLVIGRPIAPNYANKAVPYIDDSNAVVPEDGHFLKWLVSDRQDDPLSPPSLVKSANTVPLVGEGSVVDPTLEVHLEPSESNNGNYAWWVQGLNVKAKIEEELDPGSFLEVGRSLSQFGGADQSVIGVDDDEGLSKINSLHSYDLLSSLGPATDPPSKTYFHDITPYSKGLLTNVSTGGWKKDLSLMTEQWEEGIFTAAYKQNLPFFRLEPGTDYLAKEATSVQSGVTQPGELIYPWGYNVLAAGENEMCMSWNALIDFASTYKRADIMTGVEAPPYIKGSSEMRDTLDAYPVLSRLTYLYSLSSQKEGELYRPVVKVYEVYTLWNPYSVPISCNGNILVGPEYTASPLSITVSLEGKNSADEDVDEELTFQIDTNRRYDRVILIRNHKRGQLILSSTVFYVL